VEEVDSETCELEEEEDLERWTVPAYVPFRKDKVKLPHVPFNIKTLFPIQFTGHLAQIGSIMKADLDKYIWQRRANSYPKTNSTLKWCIHDVGSPIMGQWRYRQFYLESVLWTALVKKNEGQMLLRGGPNSWNYNHSDIAYNSLLLGTPMGWMSLNISWMLWVTGNVSSTACWIIFFIVVFWMID
jgi:hypothetical protein